MISLTILLYNILEKLGKAGLFAEVFILFLRFIVIGETILYYKNLEKLDKPADIRKMKYVIDFNKIIFDFNTSW